MGRYTDVDAMLEYLNLMYDKQYDMDEPFNCAVLGVINYIKHRAQTIDIVRCKECKHRGICFGRLVQGTKVVQLNFCSYGQKGDENVETD